MKVTVMLEDLVYGKTSRHYDFPGLKRRFAILAAINNIRDDYSTRMFKVTSIRTTR